MKTEFTRMSALAAVVVGALMVFAPLPAPGIALIGSGAYEYPDRRAEVRVVLYDETGGKGLMWGRPLDHGYQQLSLDTWGQMVLQNNGLLLRRYWHGLQSYGVVDDYFMGIIPAHTDEMNPFPDSAKVGDPVDFRYDIPGLDPITGTTYINEGIVAPHSHPDQRNITIHAPIDGEAHGLHLERGELSINQSNPPRNTLGMHFFLAEDKSTPSPFTSIVYHPDVATMGVRITLNYDNADTHSGEVVYEFENVFDMPPEEVEGALPGFVFQWGGELPFTGSLYPRFLVDDVQVEGELTVTVEIEGFQPETFKVSMEENTGVGYNALFEKAGETPEEKRLFTDRLSMMVQPPVLDLLAAAGWQASGQVGDFNRPVLAEEGGGLVMATASAGETFGFWQVEEPLAPLEPGRYRLVLHVNWLVGEEKATPDLRVRVSTADHGRVAMTQVVDVDGRYRPGQVSVYFTSDGESDWFVALDLLAFLGQEGGIEITSACVYPVD